MFNTHLKAFSKSQLSPTQNELTFFVMQQILRDSYMVSVVLIKFRNHAVSYITLNITRYLFSLTMQHLLVLFLDRNCSEKHTASPHSRNGEDKT